MMTPQEIGFESEEQQKEFLKETFGNLEGFEIMTPEVIDAAVPMLNELLTEDFLNKGLNADTFEDLFNTVVEWRNSLPQEELKKFEDLVNK